MATRKLKRAGNRNYRLIPGAVEWIENVMNQQGLQPVPAGFGPRQAAAQNKRFYMTPVRYRGGRAWFKASLKDEPRLLDGLRDEISTQRALADYERRARTSFGSPSWLASAGTRDRAWLLRRYWTGTYTGNMQTDFGWSPSFLRAIRPARMARVIHEVGQMTAFMRRRLHVPVHDHGWYRLDYQYYRRQVLPRLLKHPLNPSWTKQDFLEWELLFDRYRPFLKRQATRLSHGDLYPNNLMLVGRGGRQRIVLFDWELANWNLPAFDAVLVWLLAWSNPRWQTAFRRAFLRRAGGGRTMETAWNLAQLSLAVRLLAYAYLRLTNGQPQHFQPLPKSYRPRVTRMVAAMIASIHQAAAAL